MKKGKTEMPVRNYATDNIKLFNFENGIFEFECKSPKTGKWVKCGKIAAWQIKFLDGGEISIRDRICIYSRKMGIGGDFIEKEIILSIPARRQE